MAVLGTDDRVPISEGLRRELPYAAITHVEAVFPNGAAFSGSGALVGPNDLLTAAHLVYSRENGGWAVSITVHPGAVLLDRPFGSAQAIGASAAPGWVLHGNLAHDYALVALDRPIGEETGWLSIGLPDGPQVGLLVESIGYPGDWPSFPSMVHTAGTIDEASGTSLVFLDDLDTYAGASGSPVILTDEAGGARVIGIVSWESAWPMPRNGVYAFDEASLSLVQDWIAANDGPGPLGFDPPHPRSTPVGVSEVRGSARDDVLRAPDEPSLVKGGGGRDVIVYDGRRHDHLVDKTGYAAAIVERPDGRRDGLLSVEVVRFDDGQLLLDVVGQSAETVYLLYGGLLGRTPDEAGFRLWTAALDAGAAIAEVASQFQASAEFQEIYGDVFEGEERNVVRDIYRTVLQREVSDEEIGFWVEHVARERGDWSDVHVAVATSTEHARLLAPDLANGIWVL